MCRRHRISRKIFPLSPSNVIRKSRSLKLFSRNWLVFWIWWNPFHIIQSAVDPRFPGSGRTLGSGRTRTATVDNSESNLQVRLLDDSSSPQRSSDTEAPGTGQQLSDQRYCNNNFMVLAYLDELCLTLLWHFIRPRIIDSYFDHPRAVFWEIFCIMRTWSSSLSKKAVVFLLMTDSGISLLTF